jgi:hypothetical protein
MRPRLHASLLLLGALPLTGCGFLWPYPDDKAGNGTDEPTPDDADADAFDCADATFLGDQPDYADAGTVKGSVRSPSGDIPVAGAEVSVDGESIWAQSAELGCFHLDLPPGLHTLRIDKGRYTADVEVDVTEGGLVDLGALPLDSGGLRVAVIEGEYDSVEVLLGHIGLEFDRYAHPDDVLGDRAVLDGYDAVFANCGSEVSRDPNAEFEPLQLARLRAWIDEGGTLYASDQEYALFAGTVPEALSFSDAPVDVLRGEIGTVEATVLNRDVVQLLGTDRTDISFDLPAWAVIEGEGEAQVVVEGRVDGQTHPLAALHRLGEGRAVFTSFHNDAQATQDMQIILYELILAL